MINKMSEIVGKSINEYNKKLKPKIDELKFKEQYQGRIIDCMVGEIDDNYIETPETDAPIVKLEHSKEGIVKVPSIKGKTILVDSDGNETDTPAEGCKLVSVGEDEDNKLIILSKNKNLYDGELEIGYINDNGIDVVHSQCGRTKYIEVPSNYNYNISFANSNIIVDRVAFYDINKNFISISRKSSDITPNNCRYIRVGFMPTIWDNSVIVVKHIVELQIELGNNKTSYMENKHHKTEILLDEPLRNLPNGVCDERVGKQLIRRIGKVILDGSETWITDNVRVDERTHWSAYTRLTNMKSHTYYEAVSNTMKSNYFLEGKYNYCTGSRGDEHGMATIKENDNYQRILLSIRKEDMNSQDLAGFKQWLSENPTTVIYELKEPIIEELPNGITLQGFDDTTMYVENSITPTVQYGYNALIPYKEELRTQKEEVEINTLDIENNIIPYLMDMEFNLMLMEDN